MRFLIINGPNLNLLGEREPDVYGAETLDAVNKSVADAFPEHQFAFFQSNHEGALIDRLHEAHAAGLDGIVFNPAGYSHTSVALRDAIASITVPVVEVHISNVHARERFRRHSYTAGSSVGVISGLGTRGYHLAVSYFLSR